MVSRGRITISPVTAWTQTGVFRRRDLSLELFFFLFGRCGSQKVQPLRPFERSCRLLRMELPNAVDELCDITLEILRLLASGPTPSVPWLLSRRCVKCEPEGIGRLSSGPHGQLRRAYWPGGLLSHPVPPQMCHPQRAVHGSYVNTALAVDEAHMARLRRRHLLPRTARSRRLARRTPALVRRGQLMPPRNGGHPGGHNARRRHGARELRDARRRACGGPHELYAADEVFLSRGQGSRASTHEVEVDDRTVGTGSIGPVAERLQELYFKAARAASGRSAPTGPGGRRGCGAGGRMVLPPFMEERSAEASPRFSPLLTNQGGRRANYQPRYLAAVRSHQPRVASLRGCKRGGRDTCVGRIFDTTSRDGEQSPGISS